MTQALLISNVILWIAVVALGLIVLALARQVGVLLERVSPAGALMTARGLAPGEAAPSLELTAIDGQRVTIGGERANGRSTLLFFLSPQCPMCDAVLPVVRSVAREERLWLDVVLASDGADMDHREFVRRKQLGALPYVVSPDLGVRFQVAQLPYAVLMDESGTIVTLGITNTREHLESLLEARSRGVASIQELLQTRNERQMGASR